MSNHETESHWQAFEAILKQHDWFYVMADDYRAYRRGFAKAREIQEMLAKMEQVDATRAKALVAQHEPKW